MRDSRCVMPPCMTGGAWDRRRDEVRVGHVPEDCCRAGPSQHPLGWTTPPPFAFSDRTRSEPNQIPERMSDAHVPPTMLRRCDRTSHARHPPRQGA